MTIDTFLAFSPYLVWALIVVGGFALADLPAIISDDSDTGIE